MLVRADPIREALREDCPRVSGESHAQNNSRAAADSTRPRAPMRTSSAPGTFPARPPRRPVVTERAAPAYSILVAGGRRSRVGVVAVAGDPAAEHQQAPRPDDPQEPRIRQAGAGH